MAAPSPEPNAVDRPSTHITTKEGRAYVHETCGSTTVVTGGDLTGVCNPFQMVMGTICATCGFPDSTSKFQWADTGEKVSTFRRRGVLTMPLLALVSWIILPAIGGSIGGIVASNFTSPNGQQLTPLGIGLGVLVMLVFVGPF